MSVSFSEAACAHVSGLPEKNPRDAGEKNLCGPIKAFQRGNLRWEKKREGARVEPCAAPYLVSVSTL